MSAVRPRLGVADLFRKGRFVIGSVSAAVVLLTFTTVIVVTGTAASAALIIDAFTPGDRCDVVADVDDIQNGSRCSRGWNSRAPAWELHPSSSPKG